MKLPNYTKEELEFIEKWALPEDLEIDELIEKDPELQKEIYGKNGSQISTLKMAQSRKTVLEMQGIFLERISDYKEDTSPIIPPKYTKEERAIIKEWGVRSDREYDIARRVYDMNGKRVTALDLAKDRKEFLEERGQKLERNESSKKAG